MTCLNCISLFSGMFWCAPYFHWEPEHTAHSKAAWAEFTRWAGIGGHGRHAAQVSGTSLSGLGTGWKRNSPIRVGTLPRPQVCRLTNSHSLSSKFLFLVLCDLLSSSPELSYSFLWRAKGLPAVVPSPSFLHLVKTAILMPMYLTIGPVTSSHRRALTSLSPKCGHTAPWLLWAELLTFFTGPSVLNFLSPCPSIVDLKSFLVQ